MAGVATADQILATGDAVSRLSAAFAALAHAQQAPDAGRPGALPALFGFVRSEIARTAGTSPAASARMAQPRLILSLGSDRVTVDGRRGVRTLGRDIGNDLSVSEPRASRTHARIELRGNAFVVVDVAAATAHSCNWTAVARSCCDRKKWNCRNKGRSAWAARARQRPSACRSRSCASKESVASGAIVAAPRLPGVDPPSRRRRQQQL